MKCIDCGKEIIRKNNYQKRCPQCAEEKNKQRSRERYYKFREAWRILNDSK